MSLLVLGLGLFFLGMQLVGANLRSLSGKSFQNVMQRVGSRPALSALVGVGFGALMQSATAVTFILAGMQKTGLVNARSAAPVILWCNVGLTALAFLATLDIHPFVAYFVGVAGILSATIRQDLWRSVAGGLLGVGLILFGLEQMGAGAEPLRHAVWFQQLMDGAVSSPVLAFAVGIAAAALLQSNTGAAMLVITLAANGQFKLDQAALLIYGTNLGAIGLRLLLSFNLDRASKRLVRFEDIFCVWSGVVMLLLFAAEMASMPGPMAFAKWIAPSEIGIQLAILFLLSNAIPAALLAGFSGRVMALLETLMPDRPSVSLATPQYLSATAVQTPSMAADLARRECARLLASIQSHAVVVGVNSEGENEASSEFIDLAKAIEKFLAKVSSSNQLSESEATAVHFLRSELSVIRYLEGAVGEFNALLVPLTPAQMEIVAPLVQVIQDRIEVATTALDRLDEPSVSAFRDSVRKHLPAVSGLRNTALEAARGHSPGTSAAVAAVCDAFDLVFWMLHRLARTLENNRVSSLGA